jgi:hypothetical protein
MAELQKNFNIVVLIPTRDRPDLLNNTLHTLIKITTKILIKLNRNGHEAG